MTCISLLNRVLLLLIVLWASAGLIRADAPAMNPSTLRKVKRATVYLQVRVPSGVVYEGTGFLVDEPGLIVTNAHVLGMLEPNSRKPPTLSTIWCGS